MKMEPSEEFERDCGWSVRDEKDANMEDVQDWEVDMLHVDFATQPKLSPKWLFGAIMVG